MTLPPHPRSEEASTSFGLLEWSGSSRQGEQCEDKIHCFAVLLRPFVRKSWSKPLQKMLTFTLNYTISWHNKWCEICPAFWTCLAVFSLLAFCYAIKNSNDRRDWASVLQTRKSNNALVWGCQTPCTAKSHICAFSLESPVPASQTTGSQVTWG